MHKNLPGSLASIQDKIEYLYAKAQWFEQRAKQCLSEAGEYEQVAETNSPQAGKSEDVRAYVKEIEGAALLCRELAILNVQKAEKCASEAQGLEDRLTAYRAWRAT